MARKSEIGSELTWVEAVHDIPATGLSQTREATPDELLGVARALELVACTRLTATYSIMPTIGDRYRLSGSLRADISQACVVTLEPVASSIEERFEATFWPREDMPAPRGGEVDLDDEPDPEPIVAGHIAVGRIVFECLATAIDPFPRKPDAVLDWSADVASDAGDGKPESPFAVLAKIKPKD